MAITITELVAKARADVADAEAREHKARTESKLILDTVAREARANLTPEETARFETLRSSMENAKGDVRDKKANLARALEIDAEERDATASANITRPGAASPHTRDRVERVSVTGEPRTYNKGNDPDGRSFLLDVARGVIFHDVQSNERLSRHMAEERVERPGLLERAAGDATTAAFGVGLVVPQYLTDYYAPAVANLRPFADQMNKHPLPPDGMTLNLSAITTATSAALQATQLTAVSATSIAETDLSLPVCAGKHRD